MIDCIVDTHVLVDIIIQYVSSAPNMKFEESKYLTKEILTKINECSLSDGYKGVVVASTFAFVEIINQFNYISNGRFGLPKLIEILNQPPNWLVIEPYTYDTVYYLISVPKYNTVGEPVDLSDAIHVATALQRGPNSFLATHDGVLRYIDYNRLGIFHII